MAEFVPIYNDKQRKSKIKKEQKRLEEILQNVDTSKRKTVEKLMEEAAFILAYHPGEYYIYKVHNGVVNLTKKNGVPGAWVVL